MYVLGLVRSTRLNLPQTPGLPHELGGWVSMTHDFWGMWIGVESEVFWTLFCGLTFARKLRRSGFFFEFRCGEFTRVNSGMGWLG